MSDLPKREEAILKFWEEQKIFEKSLAKPAPKGEYVFYDGPPFASGLPHYGHVLAGTIKDVIPRFRTMQGYHVPRQWGWDCHGLPVENLVEKELGLKAKRDIEKFGIKEFNEAARAHIMKDDAEWKRIIPRTGRWANMDLDYKTMDPTYTESVWWAFKNLYNRGLVYEGFKSLHYCPHCGTTLSNFEVAQGYKDIEDIGVTVKFKIKNPKAHDLPENTYLLAWTTTAWTLPGNAALAVGKNFSYDLLPGEENLIVSSQYRTREGLSYEGPEISPAGKNLTGADLVGIEYEPPFAYFKDDLHKHKTHAWRVYAANFVTLEDGTGIVHIAPTFGADDLALAQKEKIPTIHHVNDEGKFIATVSDFAGLTVKPKGNPKDTDAKIVVHLEQSGLLFKEEKIKHSYPHCWRCDTPLLNWAANSWFVNVQKIKKKLIAENAKMQWVPEHVGRGRFHKGLESAPDWAIWRSRFWGAPLPVWRHSKTKEIKVAGSVSELLAMMRRSGNRYFVMRHGEADSNSTRILDNGANPNIHLTEKGKNDIVHSAQELKKEDINLIVTSPVVRAHETAVLIQKELGLSDAAIMVDKRLSEFNMGVFSGRSYDEWYTFYDSTARRFIEAPEQGETFTDVRRRIGETLFEIERRYTNKNILIVSHGNPLWLMEAIAKQKSINQLGEEGEKLMQKGEVRELPFVPFPHNDNYELDLHRPYIDEIAMGNTIDGEWKRVPDVFDCWFESGSMPFASNHYPFEKKDFNPKRLFGILSKGYPADFIAEGLDQTRGWFYSALVLGTALFGRSPYKYVVVNGLVLASDGQKMSKRLKNYPDLMEVIEKYGADSLRYFLLSSPAVRAEDLRFNERGIEEVSKKLLMRLDNVRSFYELYAPQTEKPPHVRENSLARGPVLPADGRTEDFFAGREAADHVLDKWILSRLAELVRDTTAGYEHYELDAATRPLTGFIDDLSTWYLRRSRERFSARGRSASGGKEDKEQATATLHHVLLTVAKVMAPVMPFFAESLYLAMRLEEDPESVHLCEWPTAGAIDAALQGEMLQVRTLASKGLQMREDAGVKLRQPLSLFETSIELRDELKRILMDELNVKEIKINSDLAFLEDRLDTTITPELKEEGTLRTLIRRVQEWRKEQKFTITDRPSYELLITAEEKAVAEKHRTTIMQETNLKELTITQADA